ncbi:NrfD/PsrC family molybdoenzyme membrane anchor subunit [Hippea jasoniae]|uniref:NrfD/PsrC family molybdoenzyme membrane anchor subunit n=1 Tax=Hippea jasoniae TaxID=944479 RepID=UPI00055813A2|nr:NrfD/PsrC family molybdoenzyme membrane anchor subunit [Hippea jasoniae]
MTKGEIIKKDFKITGWMVFYLLLFAVGFIGMALVFFKGQEASYGVSREISWGLLIIGYSFFVGITTGLSLLAAFGHLFGFENFHVLSRKMMWTALSALLAGFFIIFWDLGGPFRLQILRFVTNIVPFHWKSPIWWMSVLYAMELPILIVEVFLLLANKEKLTFIASILGFIVGISAYSNMGFVFSANIARPFWYGPFIPMFFILSAVALGAAFAIILLLVNRKELSDETFAITLKTFSKTLLIVLLMIIFAKIWRSVTLIYGKEPMTYEAAKQLFAGKLSFNFYFFEILLGIITPFALLLWGRFKSTYLSLISSICVIIGIFFFRYDTVVAGQLIPVNSIYFPHKEVLSYMPSIAEITLFISAVGVMGLVYTIGSRILHLEEENHG